MRALIVTALAAVMLLGGCAGVPKYVNSASLCKSWKHQTISKDDKLTQDTAAGIEGSNKARPAYNCVYGKDEAAS